MLLLGDPLLTLTGDLTGIVELARPQQQPRADRDALGQTIIDMPKVEDLGTAPRVGVGSRVQFVRAVVAVIDLTPFAKQGVGLVKQQNRAAFFRCAKDPSQILLGRKRLSSPTGASEESTDPSAARLQESVELDP